MLCEELFLSLVVVLELLVVGFVFDFVFVLLLVRRACGRDLFLSLVVVVGFVSDFVFRRGWFVACEEESLWERKWRRNLGHGPPPSEPSTYSHADDDDKDFEDDDEDELEDEDDDNDNDNDDGNGDDDDDDDKRPQPILILLKSHVRGLLCHIQTSQLYSTPFPVLLLIMTIITKTGSEKGTKDDNAEVNKFWSTEHFL